MTAPLSLRGTALAVLVLLIGLGIEGRAAEIQADWRLVDENPNSSRHLSLVSPRDYTLQVSAYYFGSAD